MRTKIIIPILTLILIATSCNQTNEKAFAYGNFETDDIIVSSESTGKLILMNIVEGSDLRKGDGLGYTDTTHLFLKKKEVNARKKAVESSLIQINKENNVNILEIENMEKEVERFRNLRDQQAATDKQVEDLEEKLSLLRARNEVLLSRRQTVFAELEANTFQSQQIEDLINKCYVVAPDKGKVLEIFAREGEFVSTGKPLFKMANLDTLTLYAYMDGSQLSDIKLGDRVEVKVDESTGGMKELRGRVSWISDEAEFTPKIIQTREDRVNLVYAFKVQVGNDGSLKIGMPGEINLYRSNGNN